MQIELLQKILRGRELYTPKELVKLGVYGSTSSVHRAIKMKEIESLWITDHRIVVTRESILKHINELTGKKLKNK